MDEFIDTSDGVSERLKFYNDQVCLIEKRIKDLKKKGTLKKEIKPLLDRDRSYSSGTINSRRRPVSMKKKEKKSNPTNHKRSSSTSLYLIAKNWSKVADRSVEKLKNQLKQAYPPFDLNSQITCRSTNKRGEMLITIKDNDVLSFTLLKKDDTIIVNYDENDEYTTMGVPEVLKAAKQTTRPGVYCTKK